MNTDNITYSVPAYENQADRYVMDESPLRLGETGAGLGLGEPVGSRLAEAERLGIKNVNAWRRGKNLPELSAEEFLNNN